MLTSIKKYLSMSDIGINNVTEGGVEAKEEDINKQA